MRSIQKVANALLMATLAKPVTRVVVSRWRKRARESKAAPVALPMQELLEAALVEELGGSPASEPAPSTVPETQGGRGALRTVLLAGAIIALVTITAVGIATVIRRRREAREAEDWVAVSVETATEVAEEAGEEAKRAAQEALTE